MNGTAISILAIIIIGASVMSVSQHAVTDATLSLGSSYILWDDETPGNDEVFYKRGTISFDPTGDLSNNGDTSDSQAIAASGYNVYAVWRNLTDLGDIEVLFRRSTDGGANFGAIMVLSNNVYNPFPKIAASGNNVYVVWSGPTGTIGNEEIIYRRSTNGGQNFGPTINLSNNAGFSAGSVIAASGNNVYVVWNDSIPGSGLLYRRSTDGGASFGPTTILSTKMVSPSAISVSGSSVYVVWNDNDPGEGIKYRRSTNGGQNFGPATILRSNTGDSPSPEIAAFGSNVYVVWNDHINPSNPEILYRKSTNGGQNFGPTINLSNNAGFSAGSVIAASGNNVYVVWNDSTFGNREILYRKSTNGGQNFGPTINLSNNPGSSDHPAIATSNNLFW